MGDAVLYHSGQLITATSPVVDDAGPGDALVTVGNRIAAVGDRADLANAYPDAKRVDLGGRTLLPGINDSHVHLGFTGTTRPPLAIDLTYPNVRNLDDIRQRVADVAADPPDDGWIRGFGWDLGLVDEFAAGDRMPHRRDIDDVAPDLPVVLQDFSGHMIWVNSRALERAGVTADTDAPDGGVVLRDADGAPTGVFQEGAQGLVQRHLPALTSEQRETALRTAVSLLHRHGVTSVTDAAMGPGGNGMSGGAFDSDMLTTLAGLVGPDGLALRTKVLMLFSPLGSAGLDDLRRGLADFTPPAPTPGWFEVVGVKLFADGIPPNKTSWMHECYADGSFGGLTVSGAEPDERVDHLHEMIRLAHEAGHQIGVHVTGDRAIDVVIDGFVAAQNSHPRPDPRHYVIHADFVTPRALRIAALHGIGLNMQPIIKWSIADMMERMLDTERANYQWPMRSVLDVGAVVAASSDSPITPPAWLQGAAAAVLRKSRTSGRVFGEDQRITVDEAVAAYTRAGAWQDREESVKGTLTPGRLADLCVVGARLRDDDPDDWAEASVDLTVVDGRVVHDNL